MNVFVEIDIKNINYSISKVENALKGHYRVLSHKTTLFSSVSKFLQEPEMVSQDGLTV